MINKVKSFLNTNNIKNKKIIIAISGGPDSVSLLYVLNSLKDEFKLKLEAAYVNHGIRTFDENLLDYDLIKNHCLKLNILLHVKNIEFGEISKNKTKQKGSTETIARDIRYNFFNSIVTKNDLIALGHNRDDQVETQIMRFFQGSSYEGLVGIKSVRKNLIRPLLDINKKDILAYLEFNTILYNIDKTNNELDYLRNKVRNSLIPVINEIFPSYKTALKHIEDNFVEVNQFIQESKMILKWDFNKKNYITNYDDFISLPIMLRREEILKIFDESYIGEINSYRLPKRFLKPLEKEFFKNNEIILEGHGFRLSRKKEILIWSHF